MKKVDLKGIVEGVTQEMIERVSTCRDPECPVTRVYMTPTAAKIKYKTVNALEIVSIKSMIAYAANQNQLMESTVRALMVDEFGVEKLEQLGSHKYDAAMTYLLEFKGLLN